MGEYPPSAWILENYGTYTVLCFDVWSDGLVEAWTVSLMQEDIDYILDDIRAGLRPNGRAGITQDLLSDYDSEHYDVGTPEYDNFAEEVENGHYGWVREEDFIVENL